MDSNGVTPPRIEIDPKVVRRGVRGGCGCGLVLLVVATLLSSLGPYTEYLWYLHDVRHPEVLTLAYTSRGTLFMVSFILSLCVLYFSLRMAFQQSLVYLERPTTMRQQVVNHLLGWVHERGLIVVKVIAPVVAFFSATSFSGEWQSWLLSGHATSFGKNDPLFGLDLGFFVFKLPWYSAVAGYLVGLALTTAIFTVGIYVGMQMLAALARIELSRPQTRLHISILVAAVCFTLAAQIWLKNYEMVTMVNAQFTGAGYASMSQLTAQKLLSILLVIVGVATLVTVRSKIPYRVPIGGGVLLGAVYLVGVLVVPAAIQRIVVEPDKINKEAPFAARAIDMTRYAYDLGRIEVKDFNVEDTPTLAEVADSQTTLDNMRLWSPDILQVSFEASQGFRSFYTFNDVDLDRYSVGGEQTMVMLAPRDVFPDGLNASAKSWVNTRLQYTHGFGVVVSPVNKATDSGQSTFLVRDIPPVTTPDFKIDEPRIYFSDFRNEESDDDSYALVDTKVDEFDYLVEDKEVTHRWTGGRGIPVGGFFAKLAFSIVLGDGNLLVSGNITSDSRLLLHRSVVARAAKVYPFLKFDDDPYIVLYNGRLIWILDGYTVSDRMPYSDLISEGDSALNYIRNSVKVTIDAYSGETMAYAIQGDEPILKAYREIYPGLVKDFKEFPKGLDAHLRYPEDLLRLQSIALRQYHVQDTTSFLNNGDVWDIPFQKGLNGSKELMRPYYVQMRLPGEPKDGFMQILPFTPRQKGNMAGWLAALCDPGSYGRVILYKYTRGSLVPGPELMESKFNQDETISNLNKQLSNEQSQIRVGNLLVIPIGRSVMYVEPLFLQSRTTGLQAIPELRKVILALNNKIVVGDNYRQALTKLFGDEKGTRELVPGDKGQGTGTAGPGTQGQGTKGPANATQVDSAKVREALGLLDDADKALKNGDFAKYGELQKQAKAKLKALVGQ